MLIILVFFFHSLRNKEFFFEHSYPHTEGGERGEKQIVRMCGSLGEGISIRRDKRLKFEGTFFSLPLSFFPL